MEGGGRRTGDAGQDMGDRGQRMEDRETICREIFIKVLTLRANPEPAEGERGNPLMRIVEYRRLPSLGYAPFDELRAVRDRLSLRQARIDS